MATRWLAISSSSGDRVFELDLGGEAVVITPDRQNRQLPAAMLIPMGLIRQSKYLFRLKEAADRVESERD